MKREIAELLNAKVKAYNQPKFIGSDPIQIPHQYTNKHDIEISAFFAATIAWGQRKTIIANASKLCKLMGNSPYDFVMNHNERQLKRLSDFKHRTFNGFDAKFFVKRLKFIYGNMRGMEYVFHSGIRDTDRNLGNSIANFRTHFLGTDKVRTSKHISNPLAGSAAKRLVMFLRWMVRKDNCGVDFGIWDSISPSLLSCPLDVHSGRVARALGILERKQNDWKAVIELDIPLRELDATDPAKFDFALFGLGVHEEF